jgi:hypothetical protein
MLPHTLLCQLWQIQQNFFYKYVPLPVVHVVSNLLFQNAGVVVPAIFFGISAICTIYNYNQLAPNQREFRKLVEELGVKSAVFIASVGTTALGAVLFGPPGIK